MQSPQVKIKNLYKIFYKNILNNFRSSLNQEKKCSPQDKMALENINIEFNSGESIGIVGKNGAGKSTLLSIIAGLAKPTSGQIDIIGKVTAVMTLGVGLKEDLTGRENIYLDGELQGKTCTEIDVFINEIIEFSELHEFIDTPIKYYSTGMKSRLAFSMLVCIEPEILIIDEALSAGDVFFAEKAAKRIKEICSIGKIVMIVSHSMNSINALCNRCLWMEQGQIIQDGDPETITKNYLMAVQEEDRSMQAENVQMDYSKTIESAKYHIKKMSTKLGQANYSQRVFNTEDFFIIEIIISRFIETQPDPGVLNVSIERIDGIIVDIQVFHLSEISYSESGSEFQIELALESLVLNKGFYRIKAEIIEDQVVSNEFSRFFEVKNSKMAKGGHSLLHYPAQIKLLTKELSTCLDSIELMVD
jgi:lipopolysaccharide transport system ATP-binding protein